MTMSNANVVVHLVNGLRSAVTRSWMLEQVWLQYESVIRMADLTQGGVQGCKKMCDMSG